MRRLLAVCVVSSVQPTLEGAAQRFAGHREGVPRPARLEFDHPHEIGSAVAVAVRIGDRLGDWPQPRAPSLKQPHTPLLPFDKLRHNKSSDRAAAGCAELLGEGSLPGG